MEIHLCNYILVTSSVNIITDFYGPFISKSNIVFSSIITSFTIFATLHVWTLKTNYYYKSVFF